jgi:hypothetical protein
MQAWHRDGCESCGQGQDASHSARTYCNPPVSVPSNGKTRTKQHTSGVERAVSNTARNRGGFCHDDDQDQQQLRIGGSIWSGTAAPPTVLVVDMGNGSLLPQGRNDEPRASLNPPDAMPLRRKLTAALGRTELTPHNGQGEAG